ncbi:hypothetical protein DFH07DRAFT_988865 [Mycena maculata]|uniref:DUF6534 domain-containing protein n=1 Tax=Mycena maculata TaxID=230809 RepID=A0AAD7MVA1_9AGAR|nr:hypothetical protein DFH07DRAFT_988865 [Mycena maculata]
MSGLLTGEDKREANFLLGPWLIGSCLDLILQGVLSSQFVNYYTWYGDDKSSLRFVVGFLALLTTLKSIQAFAIIWIQFIVYFGDLQGAILLNYTTWWQSGNPLMVALIGLYVQTYFCFRLWVISRKWYVVAPIATIFLFAFLAIVVATYFITTANGPEIGNWFAAHLSSVFAGDVILSSTTAYFLLQSKKNVLPQTVGLISALVRLTFQTAAPAALCAMFNLIFSQVYPGGVAIVSTAFNMALPKLYAVSMMWTLNARRTIRATHSSRNGMTNTASNELSGGRSRAQRRPNGGDMELGAIQVLTQTETTQHIDVRDMFDPTNGKGDVKHVRTQVDTKKSDDESVQYSK